MEIYSTDEVEENASFESAIVLANHRYTVDWVINWVAAEHYHMLGQCKAFIKAVVAKFPIIGWSMWFNEYCFLSRQNKRKDINTILKSIQHLKEYTEPCWLLLYPEGTRFNKAKHAESMNFAKDHGLPELSYLLLPRPRGFHEIVSNLHGSNVKAIYDCTFQIENDFDVPISNWLRRRPTKLKLAVTRIDLDSVPTEFEESKKFIYKLFQEKDKLFGKMLTEPNAAELSLPGSAFYSKPMRVRRDKTKPWKPLPTTLFWACVILYPILGFLYKAFTSSLLGCLVTTVAVTAMNLAVAYLLEMFHKKPSSYGLKKE